MIALSDLRPNLIPTQDKHLYFLGSQQNKKQKKDDDYYLCSAWWGLLEHSHLVTVLCWMALSALSSSLLESRIPELTCTLSAFCGMFGTVGGLVFEKSMWVNERRSPGCLQMCRDFKRKRQSRHAGEGHPPFWTHWALLGLLSTETRLPPASWRTTLRKNSVDHGTLQMWRKRIY